MNRVFMGVGVFVGVILLFALSTGLWVKGVYNGLTVQSEVVDTSWAEVETQYQRRFDLIPGLVNSVRGFLKQERGIMEAVAEARTRYASTEKGSPERAQAASGVESALARLLVVMENYPNLKSDATVRALMDELAGTENRVNIHRSRYNEQVRVYNTQLKVFPRNFVASAFGFESRDFFESDEAASKAVNVNLE